VSSIPVLKKGLAKKRKVPYGYEKKQNKHKNDLKDEPIQSVESAEN